MDTLRIAEAFSGHRFPETYDSLAPDVLWVLPGHAVIEGRDAVIAACDSSAAEMAHLASAEFSRFVSTRSSASASSAKFPVTTENVVGGVACSTKVSTSSTDHPATSANSSAVAVSRLNEAAIGTNTGDGSPSVSPTVRAISQGDASSRLPDIGYVKPTASVAARRSAVCSRTPSSAPAAGTWASMADSE